MITGGAGNIGGSLARKLVATGRYHVTIVDDFSTGSREKLPHRADTARWEVVDANVNRDLAALHEAFSRRKYDAVFHYAALVGVQRTLANPLRVLEDLRGIENMLDLCHGHSVPRYFYASSSEVYGEPVSIPQFESTTPLNSKLPYAVVKNAGEVFARAFEKERGQHYTIFRFFNTYGPQQSTDFVISRFVSLALHDEPLTIYGDGAQTRTFCYVDDNIEATLSALENGLGVNQTINIGSDQEITILELAKTVIDVLGSGSKIVHLPPLPEGDMSRRKPDISLMKSLRDKPLTSLRSGIEMTARSYARQKAIS
jgi:UDP-glucose 4-epimerase